MLRPAGHHAVGLIRALDRQIVHHHADVSLCAVEYQWLFAERFLRGVDAGQQSLRGGFLIARGPVDLSGEIEARDVKGAHGGGYLQRIDAVVLNGVSQARQPGLLEAGYGAVHRPLHILRKAGGHALYIPLRVIKPFRFQKQLVTVLIGEAVHLILNGWAVARACALDRPRKHGGAVKVVSDDVVRALIGPGQVAGGLVGQVPVCQKGEGNDWVIARLDLHPAEVDAAGVDPGGGAGLEAAQLKAQFPEAPG